MAEMDKVEYEFPDEKEEKLEAAKPEVEFEIEDDTPEEDRGRRPLPKELVEKLEVDELDKYSAEAKEKLVQMKKVWHDERREKESADRERNEALRVAHQLMEENKRLKQTLNVGEEMLHESVKDAAEKELSMAKRAFKEAYESGDSDALAEAQEKITKATLRLENAEKQNLPNKLKKLKEEAYQEERNVVQIPQQEQPRIDPRAAQWQNNNVWFGQDEEMTAAALGLHEKLKRSGVLVGSEEYYKRIDETMRKRFPEQFEDPEVEKPAAEPARKPSNVVAPATRSTSPKKIKLTNTQVALAKKLGLTPEQYALEIKKLEAQNG